ncbi:MAG TPA: hypothetical protein PKX00_14810, partial [Opitutaceae bacterium]|nr:hypothetical protein [Opitutaceae bacterium]
ASRIEGALAKSDQGVQISTEVASTLNEIVSNIRQLDTLVAEIAQSTGEESKGIEEVTKAIAQMDQVTQGNAAGAEESASASEELSAQAHELNALAASLLSMVDGRAATVAPRTDMEVEAPSVKPTAQVRAKQKPARAQAALKPPVVVHKSIKKIDPPKDTPNPPLPSGHDPALDAFFK